jgi:HTH-like domain
VITGLAAPPSRKEPAEGIARSTYYDQPKKFVDDTALVEAIAAICDAVEAYGWRRGQAALRQRGVVANHKKIRWRMREYDLQPSAPPLRGDERPRSRPTNCRFAQKTWPSMVPTSSGCRISPTSARRRFRLCRRHPRRMVPGRRRLRHQPLDRRAPHGRRAAKTYNDSVCQDGRARLQDLQLATLP